MEENIIKSLELDNNQTVRIFDLSRKISEDAYVVRIAARINIAVEKELLTDDQLKGISFEHIIEKLGTHVEFEFTNERNFIMSKDKDKVLQNLVNTFTDNLIEYLSKESFPGKFIFKQYGN